MSLKLSAPEAVELKPRIVVIGVGGAGGNAVNNMIRSGLQGVEFIVANTDAQALKGSTAERKVQLGAAITQGLGCGARPEVGRAAAEETIDTILDHLQGTHMAFITAGMGGGTGTGAAPVIARTCRDSGMLTIGVVTKPFQFEGTRRMQIAERGIEELQKYVDTLIIIPNQNLFRVANEKTTFAAAFQMADEVLHSGVRGITDLMVMPGLINLDFADVKTVMSEMGKAMMGTGEAEGATRALDAAARAISNPLLDDVSIKGAQGVLINIAGGLDLTLHEVDEAANCIRQAVDPDANIIVGSALDDSLNGKMRISVVATGIDVEPQQAERPVLTVVGGNAVARPASTPDPVARTEARSEPPPAALLAASPTERPIVASGGGVVGAAARVLAPEVGLAASAMRVPEAKPLAPEREPLQGKPQPAPENRAEPFMPPAPREPAGRPELFRNSEAAPATAESQAVAKDVKRGRGGSLLRRMTGAMLSGGDNKAPAAAAAVAVGDLGPAKETAAPTLGRAQPPVDGKLLAPKPEEDILDIPSFLRRQAN
ncbi:MAG: cell division protein FtsZ [Alphaproteobacteria bacterium]|nr:cell division protein FtsZ [Alphaproteobacteria bacterium]